MKDLVFKEQPVRKLVDQYVGPYTIEEVVFTNVVILTTNLDEDPSGCECQSDSMIQGASRGTEKVRG